MRVNDVDKRYSSYEGYISFYSRKGVLPQTLRAVLPQTPRAVLLEQAASDLTCWIDVSCANHFSTWRCDMVPNS